MAKEIKMSEEKWHETTAIGTIVGIMSLSTRLSDAVDSVTGGGERTKYILEVDGKRSEFDSEEARDNAAKKSI